MFVIKVWQIFDRLSVRDHDSISKDELHGVRYLPSPFGLILLINPNLRECPVLVRDKFMDLTYIRLRIVEICILFAHICSVGAKRWVFYTRLPFWDVFWSRCSYD